MERGMMTAMKCCGTKLPPKPFTLADIDKRGMVQRLKLASEAGVTATNGRINPATETNWVNVGEAWFAIKLTRGRQAEVMENQQDVTPALGCTHYDELTGAITASMRIVINYGQPDARTWQVVSPIDDYMNHEWLLLGLAEIKAA